MRNVLLEWCISCVEAKVVRFAGVTKKIYLSFGAVRKKYIPIRSKKIYGRMKEDPEPMDGPGTLRTKPTIGVSILILTKISSLLPITTARRSGNWYTSKIVSKGPTCSVRCATSKRYSTTSLVVFTRAFPPIWVGFINTPIVRASGPTSEPASRITNFISTRASTRNECWTIRIGSKILCFCTECSEKP